MTVHSAYAELQAQGLIESHVGRGTFVTMNAPAVPERQRLRQTSPSVSQGILANLLRGGERGDVLSFTQAFPAPETYPTQDLARMLQHALTRTDALSYGHGQGEPELRENLASLLLERGLAVSPEDMLITAGAQQGIDLVLRALTQPEDVILVEEPIYPGILERAAQRGQRVVGIPNNDGTLRTDILEAMCSAHRPRLIYLVPTYNNPTGRTLARKSRDAVLRVASTHDMLVLEDDTYGFLGFDSSGPPALKSNDGDDRIVYITSVSKSLAPALRLGALVAPIALLPALAAAKQSSDLVCSALMQRALAVYLQQGHMTSHLHDVRLIYQQRCNAMLDALDRFLPQCAWMRPQGGLSLWVHLPPGVVERDFTADALQQGIGVAPGAAFFPETQDQGSMRLSFGAHPPERIEAGIKTLGHVLEDHLQRRDRMSPLRSGAGGPLV
ncbi:MAG: PLP-dependent aminotransferase family protein [Chloroflexota bacterium]